MSVMRRMSVGHHKEEYWPGTIGYKADGPGPFVFRSFFEIFAVAISGSVWTRSGVRYYCQLQ